MKMTGIDISRYQGNIEWEKVKNEVDFVIIRAGYGQNNRDAYFKKNADECTRLGIPFGVYWFSYAYTPGMARNEADYVCAHVKSYNLQYPIFFDFEYDSTNYAECKGMYLTEKELANVAKSFLERVSENGYYPAIYSNPDYIKKGFYHLIGIYDLWLAHWDIAAPEMDCEMWQYTSKGKVHGITGPVDMNICYVDYPSIIGKMKEEKNKEDLEKVKEEMWEAYCQYAKEVWQGKYGNGAQRKIILQDKGIDYKYVQKIVNLTTKEG